MNEAPRTHGRTPRALVRTPSILLAATTVTAALVFGSGVAAADGLPDAPAASAPVSGAVTSSAPASGVVTADGTRIESVTAVGGNRYDVTVYSPSMDRVIDLQVLRPADTSAPRPTLYLLNGASGGEDPSSNWPDQADIEQFFADKNVNVIVPKGGAFSYYTDWRQDDPELGRNKWETFLTKELPPVVDASFGTSGRQAIAGISMSGSAVLMLAANSPGLYSSVASYSGCARTSDPVGQFYVNSVVEARGGGDTVNMWGEADDPLWAENDAFLQAEKLRGTPIYVTTGSGLPGRDDNLASPRLEGSPVALANRVIVGGLIEAATAECTRQLAGRLAELQIPATFDFRPDGTHSWEYWQQDLKDSWAILGPSIGA